jgi:hypothetical protein
MALSTDMAADENRPDEHHGVGCRGLGQQLLDRETRRSRRTGYGRG